MRNLVHNVTSDKLVIQQSVQITLYLRYVHILHSPHFFSILEEPDTICNYSGSIQIMKTEMTENGKGSSIKYVRT